MHAAWVLYMLAELLKSPRHQQGNASSDRLAPCQAALLAGVMGNFTAIVQASTKPVSVMQPHPAGSTAGGTSGAAVRSAAFAALAEQDVPVDTVFFHK